MQKSFRALSILETINRRPLIVKLRILFHLLNSIINFLRCLPIKYSLQLLHPAVVKRRSMRKLSPEDLGRRMKTASRFIVIGYRQMLENLGILEIVRSQIVMRILAQADLPKPIAELFLLRSRLFQLRIDKFSYTAQKPLFLTLKIEILPVSPATLVEPYALKIIEIAH